MSTRAEQDLTQILIELAVISGQFKTSDVVDKNTKESIDQIKLDVTNLKKLYDRVKDIESTITFIKWAIPIFIVVVQGAVWLGGKLL